MVKIQIIPLSKISEEISNRFDVKFLSFQILSEQKGYIGFDKLFDVVDKSKINLAEEYQYCEIGNVQKTGDINPVLLDKSKRDETNEKFFKKIEKGDIIKPQKGDILIASVRPNLKKFIFIDSDKENIYFTKAFIHLRPKLNGILLYYLLRRLFFENLISISREGKGYPTIKTPDLKYLKFDNEIVAKIFKQENEVVPKIKKIEQEIKTLKIQLLLPRKIINEVFAKEFGLDFEKIKDNRNVKAFNVSFSNYSGDSELRFSVKHIFYSKEFYKTLIPLFRFKEVLLDEPLYGANEQAKDGIVGEDIRYIRITDIDDIGELKDEEWKTTEKSEYKYLLEDGDFLFARSGNTVGKTFLYDSSKLGKAIFAGYFIKFKIDTKKLNPLFLLFYSKSIIFDIWKNMIIRVMGQPNINAEEYKNLPIPDIPLNRQNTIVEKIKSRLDEQERKRKTIAQKRNEIDRIIERILKR